MTGLDAHPDLELQRLRLRALHRVREARQNLAERALAVRDELGAPASSFTSILTLALASTSPARRPARRGPRATRARRTCDTTKMSSMLLTCGKLNAFIGKEWMERSVVADALRPPCRAPAATTPTARTSARRTSEGVPCTRWADGEPHAAGVDPHCRSCRTCRSCRSGVGATGRGAGRRRVPSPCGSASPRGSADRWSGAG